jgi:AraC family transcriptional regulator, transcriptional activator of pobA
MNAALSAVENANTTSWFRIFDLEKSRDFHDLQRNSCYSLIWIVKGTGKVMSDFDEYPFSANTIFAFSPYQAYGVERENDIEGVAILFHPDFFCIHKHQKEVACNGVLFNNIYEPPFILPDMDTSSILAMLVRQMKDEFENSKVARNEVLLSYLKVFLITASRFKADQYAIPHPNAAQANPPAILQALRDNIEKHFKDKRSASEYAAILHISVKALAKITKTYFNKTIGELVAEKVIIEAKRELYLTNKPVKEIARDLGYEDEYYFSRFFKTHVTVSPQIYRHTIGYGKGVA